MKSLVQVLFILLLFTACKEKISYNKSGYIVGATNDIERVSQEVLSKIPLDVFNAAVLIATKSPNSKSLKICSGILVAANPTESANPRVVTNAHCFSKEKTLLSYACVNTKVYFGFAPETDRKLSINSCKNGSLRVDYTADLAVFTLQNSTNPENKALQLWNYDIDPTNRAAFIVHFPDIKDRLSSLKGENFKVPMASLTMKDCHVIGRFKKTEWSLDSSLPYSVRHSCDLLHGSSGSALIDLKTHKILGTNWGGIKIANPKQASNNQSKKNINSSVLKNNVAVTASYVKEFLKGPMDENRRIALVGEQPQVNIEEKRCSTLVNNTLKNKSGVYLLVMMLLVLSLNLNLTKKKKA